MKPTSSLLALAFLATLLTSPAHGAEKSPEPATAATEDREHARLVSARKQAHEMPEVLAAHQQAKADRAQAQKAQTEYQTANKRALASEEAYRKALEAGLTKVDPEAAVLVEKEKAAFRERMVKARELRKAQVTPRRAATEEPDERDNDEAAR
jgi:hypothetical protein